ncbi:MAG: PhoH family protein [Candidatus Pacebacteria bacterium]|nr:PhoH family protein [Candidatus Paceibacterota bacterium]
MASARTPCRKIVLDTNVLMHDPLALTHFQEHDIHLPMQVIEELDKHKSGLADIARNVRTVHRYLDTCQEGLVRYDPEEGVSLKQYGENGTSAHPTGRLFYQTASVPMPQDLQLSDAVPDNRILAYTWDLNIKYPGRVVLVSKDKNIRIKAFILGIPAEDYSTDRVLDDMALLHPGYQEFTDDFWSTHARSVESWQEEGRMYYRIVGPMVSRWFPGLFLHIGSDRSEFVVRSVEPDNSAATVRLITNYMSPKRAVWGINARNREQNYALNLLTDPDIDFVSLIGPAGTGKTLLTLAAGLQQVNEERIYAGIIMTRVTVPVGEDIGFLPGTEEEKMTPWMGALMDNLEVLTPHDTQNGDWGRSVTTDLIKKNISVKSLNFMRGSSFQHKFIILDEAQNLTSKQMRTLVSRSGAGSKVICLGNLGQIDTPYLTETTSGLTFAVERFRKWEHSGHVTLQKGERSRLADYVNEELGKV